MSYFTGATSEEIKTYILCMGSQYVFSLSIGSVYGSTYADKENNAEKVLISVVE